MSLLCLEIWATVHVSFIYVKIISRPSLERSFQPRMNEDKIDCSLNTLSKLNHSVTTMNSDIYFMRHCLLTVIIPAREHSETLNTSTALSIKVGTARKKSVKKVCSKSPGPTDVWISPHPILLNRSNCSTAQ